MFIYAYPVTPLVYLHCGVGGFPIISHCRVKMVCLFAWLGYVASLCVLDVSQSYRISSNTIFPVRWMTLYLGSDQGELVTWNLYIDGI